MDTLTFLHYFNSDSDWFNKFYREQGYNRDASLEHLTGNEVEEGFNDRMYEITDFLPFIIDCCFYMREGLFDQITRLMNSMNESQQISFLKRFKLVLEGIDLIGVISHEKVFHQTRKANGDTRFIESIQIIRDLPNWVDRAAKHLEYSPTHSNSISPLFTWQGDITKLVELILILCANKWIRVNSQYSSPADIARKIQEMFLVSKDKNVSELNLSTLKTYFDKLDATEINSLTMEGIAEIVTKKLDGSKIAKESPFKDIRSPQWS